MLKGSNQSDTRIPEEVDSIQVNFCRNPGCANFGVPASLTRQDRGRNPQDRDQYKVIGTGDAVPGLACRICGEHPTIKSNRAIAEEFHRFWKAIDPKTDREVSCPKPDCQNHGIDVIRHKDLYHSFGKTAAGSPRYRCKLCRATFVAKSSTRPHRKPHKNAGIFRLLVNKMPFRRICEVEGITMDTLYRKIDFIHRQCMAFAAGREARLSSMPLRRLYISVDRQDYVINWAEADDRRNIIFHAVGSADNNTGYVFGIHLNFDASISPDAAEREAIACGDYDWRPPFRRYARIWLKGDYIQAVQRSRMKSVRASGGSLHSSIEATYSDAVTREDTEISETIDEDITLPKDGVQVHAEYTLYGHFFFLRKLLDSTERVRFFLDQDSGIRAACLSAFCDRIKEDRCDAFYVRINDKSTIDEKRDILADSRKKFQLMNQAHPELEEWQVKLLMIKEAIARLESIGKWQDKWVKHPFPNMGEPEKAMCYLTDVHAYDEDHRAWLYNKASLHAVDRFFMQVRRRLSLLERSITTSASFRRHWSGYGPYKPSTVGKLLDIFRVFYDYVETGKNKQTPATRLGLAKGKVSIEDIIYYRE